MTLTGRLLALKGGSAGRLLVVPKSTRRTTPLVGSKRWKHSFSSYEYPLATQAPTITKTTVEQVAEIGKHPRNEILDKKFPPPHQQDVFDDAHALSGLETDSIRTLQKEYLPTSLEGSTAIESIVPTNIPANVPSESLQVPQTLLTTLPNGVRVVSQETYGQVCTIGVLLNAGSRHETITGTCHLLEMLAFHSTASPRYDSVLKVSKQLQDWGATSFANTGREQVLYCLDILRPNVHEGMQLLAEVVLEPCITDEEVSQCLKAMEYQAHEIMPELLLGEVLQQAAYGPTQQLGKRHFCPLEALTNLNANVVKDFCQAHIIHNPQGLVVAGAGIGHDELVDMASHYFGQLQQHTLPEQERTIPSTYVGGGRATLQHHTMDGFTRMALALQVGGWHSDDLVPTCVLQTLLGGGNSFSAGGPGKGMYSRLYRQVLNRYYWAESAEAFTAFHNETGLFGMSASSATPEKIADLTNVLAQHFHTLSVDLVSDEEFERACNMLKNNVLSQLESRLVLFEDMGRQVLTYGHREDTDTMCRKIDAVTKEDLRELVRRALQEPPTLAAVGDNVSHVPSIEQVQKWMK